MLWLKENNIVTENIIEGDIDKLQKLRKQLLNEGRYVLSDAKAHTGYGCSDEDYLGIENYFECKHLGHNGNGAKGNIFMVKTYDNPTPISLWILYDACGEKQKDINLIKMFKQDDEAMLFIRNIHKRLDLRTANVLINRLWPDFHFFVNEILDNISLKRIEEYDINEVKSLHNQCKKLGFSTTPSDVILKQVPIAENNAKVLTLARKITDNK